MPFRPDSVLRLRRPLSRFRRYVLALAVVAVATLLRLAVDPLIHDQIPFFIYVASVVVATWFCGVDGGILATVVAAFVGNYFFVPPRYDLLPGSEDLLAMSLFSAVSLGLVWQVGRWRRAERELRQVHAETSAVLDQMPVGVMMADASGTLRFGNAAMETIFGRRVVPSSSVAQWRLHADYQPTFPDGRAMGLGDTPMARALRNGEKIADEELHIVHGDGKRRVLSAYAAPVRDEDNRVTGAVVAMLDVTGQKAAGEALRESERRLREQADALAEANRLKDEFLSVLSHELRTPLSAILGWSDVLMRRALDADTTQRALEAINRNARAQSMLIGDVLDVSRIVSGKLRLDVRPVDLSLVLQAALETTKPAADAKQIEVRTSVAGRPIVIGDPDRLQQILWNLLSNSVKFTNPGGHVAVSIRRVESAIEVRVRDDGAGIPADFLPHVFERFRQHDSSMTRDQQSGLGLGLAIVRHLAELHGGAVRAESAGEGMGAEFIVTLPVRAVFEPQTARERAAAREGTRGASALSSSTLAGVRVLVVDDQPDARALLDAMLRRSGADVALCESAVEGIASVERERPDVLVADIGMPLVDGYEMLARIRDIVGCDALPAVALTAFGGSEDRRRALDAGYQEHVAKPVTADVLVSALISVLGASPHAERSGP